MIFFLDKLSTPLRFLVNNLNARSHKRVVQTLSRPVTQATNSYFFQSCALCGSSNSQQALLCDSCETDLLATRCGGQCQLCSIPLPSGYEHSQCPECRMSPPKYDSSHVVTTYEFPSTTLIHQLKYEKKRYIALILGHLLAKTIERSIGPLPDLICCVPMHPNKIHKKHYNHACEIAHLTATKLSLPFYPQLLIKTQQTESQSKLGRSERFKNLRNSIEVTNGAYLIGKHIAVIDDVMTTGATFDCIASLLKNAGAGRVEVWAFARTSKPVKK